MRNALDLVGHTPLIELDHGISAKLECMNPSGSIKDRMVKFMLEQAERRGELTPGATIVEATSGNTGIALSLMGRLKGYKVKIFMPEYMSLERKKLVTHFGATLCLTSSMEEARARVAEEARQPGVFPLNQFRNTDNIEAHRLGTGQEILAQLPGDIDYFVAGVGTGGTIMGVGRALKARHPKIKIIGVMPVDPKANKIEGIGCYYLQEIVNKGFIDEVLDMSNDEAITAARGLGERFGFFVGISSGANYAAARKFKGTIVTVLPDSANRYMSTQLFEPQAQAAAPMALPRV